MFDHFGDKEFERLFQKGSEQYDFEYNPEAWSQMEKLLDAQKRQKAIFWWSRTAGIVLLLAVFVWLVLAQMFEDTPKNGLDPAREDKTGTIPDYQRIVTETPDLRQMDSGDLRVKSDQDKRNREAEYRQISEGVYIDQQTSISSQETAQIEILIAREDVVSDDDRATDALSEYSSEVQIEEAGRQRIHPDDIQKFSDELENSSQVKENSLPGPLTSDNRTGIASLPLEQLSRGKILEIVNSIAPSIIPFPALPGNLEEAKTASLFLGLNMAPTVSSAGSMGFKDWDWRIGLSGSYLLSNHIGLGIGLLYVRDSYEAGKYDYAPSYGFWTDRVAPELTTAMCDILEIPLFISIYPSGISHSGFFGSAGISSLIMMREAYYYHYEDPQPNYIKYWRGNMDNQDWFSMMEFSIGYRWNLSGRHSISLSPYIQLPIRGIGHGNVKLYALGVNAGYGFGLK